MKFFWSPLFVIGFLFSFLIPGQNSEAMADETTYQACAETPSEGKKGKVEKKGEDIIMVVLLLEGQGKGNLRPEYEEPVPLCLAAELTSGETTAQILYTPLKKGIQTLHYQVLAEGPSGPREFLMLYSGTSSLVSGGSRFYVSETRDGTTSFYIMYKNQPNFETVQALFQDILDGKWESLIEVDWPEDSPELLINKYDTDRMK